MENSCWMASFATQQTSLQSEGACATSPRPLPCVSVKKRLKLPGNERKRRFFYRMGTVPLFFVKASMEFLFGQKMELIF